MYVGESSDSDKSDEEEVKARIAPVYSPGDVSPRFPVREQKKEEEPNRPPTSTGAAIRESKRKKQLEEAERRKQRSRQGVISTAAERPDTAHGTPAKSGLSEEPKKQEESSSEEDVARIEEPKKEEEPKKKHHHHNEESPKKEEQAEVEEKPKKKKEKAGSDEEEPAKKDKKKEQSEEARESKPKHKSHASSSSSEEAAPAATSTEKASHVAFSSSPPTGPKMPSANPRYYSGPAVLQAPLPADLINFVNRPGPRGVMVMCKIQLASKGFGYPTYMVYLEETNQFLLSARKRKRSKTPNYLISTDSSDLARASENYIGKVRSNFVGSEFSIYDNGDNPKKNPANPRSELVGASNVLGLHGPRKMVMLIPTIDEAGHMQDNKPLTPRDSLVERYKAGNTKNIVTLINKPPVWNEASQAYVLNFHRRVKVASVKNFQVIEPSDVDTVLMQFGRVSPKMFILDYQYPFTLLQALGIALSSFDKKLACE